MTGKERVAKAVLSEIQPDMIVGIGTGSTVDCLIDLLSKDSCHTIVSSSSRTTDRLKSRGIEPVLLNQVSHLDIYIDGADQVNPYKVAIKGRGGALTLEKIMAISAKQFIGIVTEEKRVTVLSDPLPVEILHIARSSVVRQLVSMGIHCELRSGRTDNDQIIIDTFQWDYKDTDALELLINGIPGVVDSGLFSKRRFDRVYIEKSGFVEVYE